MGDSPLLSSKNKTKAIHDYLFPEDHTISLHHSISNIDTLFYIRLGSLIYISGVYLWSFTLIDSLLVNIIYLTMQGYFLTWLYFLATMQDYMINGFGKWGRVFPLCNNLKYYVEILYEIAFCIQLPITIIFWGFLFKILLNMEGVTPQIIANNVNLHGGPMICLSLDMAFNTFSFPKRHFIIIAIFSFIYSIINLIYSLQVHVIYKPIDWKSVLSYILMAAALAMAYGMHVLGRCIYQKWKKPKLQMRITQGLIHGQSSKSSMSKEQDSEGGKKSGREKGNIQGQDNDLNTSVITEVL